MRKWIYLLLLITFFTGNNIAQTQGPNATTIYLAEKLPCEDIETEASALLLKQFHWLTENQNELVLISNQKSQVGRHLLFAHFHQGALVYKSSVKINIANDGSILSVTDHLIRINCLAVPHTATFKSSNGRPVYAMSGSGIKPLYLIKEKDASGVLTEYLVNEWGAIASQQVLDLLLGRKDTVVSTKVFNPDPLTTAQKIYGQDSVWLNKNGADYVELNAQRVPVNVTLEISNDTFYTGNKYAVIVDTESPFELPYKSTVNNFDFTRSKAAFREMMALYHLQHYREYLAGIGLPLDSMFRVNVDINAYGGSDMSRFSTQNDNPTLYFGTGGVPDAEDADVIIHEYTHGITYFIAPHTTSGNERMAFEEGNCDFMACQYSKAVSNFNWRQVFNWDGHNGYWDGRNGDSPKKYPIDMTPSDYYSSSEIWSSMLNDVSLDMGRDVTTKLLVASIYSYTEDMSMQRAAELLVEADSLLYGKMHYWALKSRLVERGFDISMGLNPAMALESNFTIINSAGFAISSGDLKIESRLNKAFTWSLYNLEGKLVMQDLNPQTEVSISPQSASTGMYLLKITSGNQSFVSRLVRLQ